MGLLQPANNNIAYLKAGLFGFQGTGKTYTAIKQAVHLWLYLKELGLKPGPVAMFDTENGSAFAEPDFRRHDIPFFVFRGRAFKKLIEVGKEAINENFSIFIVDSTTHVWRDLVNSYVLKIMERKNLKFRPRLSMPDWGPIKEEWQQFPDMIVNAPIHMFVLGRAGFEYDTNENDDGSYDLIKTGTKFKAETEFGFEPSIVFEMMRIRFNEEGREIGSTIGKNKKGKTIRAGLKGTTIEKHRAYCVKDRNMNPETTLDGKFFDFEPGGNESAPFDILKEHLAVLNIGGEGVGLNMGNSTELFGDPDFSRFEYKRQIEIAGEHIKEALILAELDGNAAAAKKQRVEVLMKCFGTSSWTEIMSRKLPEIRAGLSKLRDELGITVPEKKAENEPPPPTDDDAPIEAVA